MARVRVGVQGGGSLPSPWLAGSATAAAALSGLGALKARSFSSSLVAGWLQSSYL